MSNLMFAKLPFGENFLKKLYILALLPCHKALYTVDMFAVNILQICSEHHHKPMISVM